MTDLGQDLRFAIRRFWKSPPVLGRRRAHPGFRKALVIVQVALSLLLLVGAGLVVRTLENLRSLDPGFEPERLLTFTVNPALNGYELNRRVSKYPSSTQRS